MTCPSMARFCAAICFGSFAWGMAYHFQRPARHSSATAATGAIAIVCALVQLAGLSFHAARFSCAALPLYASGCAIFWWAVTATRGCLDVCGSGRESLRLVKRGPYALVRHPFYTAYNLVWLAGFVATGWWPLAVTAILMAGLYEHFARKEEAAYLGGEFAAEYRAYQLGTHKYLPRLRCRR